ncbi:MAG: ABC transporter permease [Kangiellaceae bacterium]
MQSSIQTIPLTNLALAFIPVAIALFILIKWSLNAKSAVYALTRMLGQLLLIGYFLSFIFESESSLVVLLVLSVMVFSSSWIALRTVEKQRLQLFRFALLSVVIGGGSTLVVISQLVLQLKPWFLPHYMIPLAGMIFATSMNSVSLAAERLSSELKRGEEFIEARRSAIEASLIPAINSLLAVGLVSLPGMMTGQILSGVSPLVAVRYQIMVMCMVFAASVICAALFLVLSKKSFLDRNE